MGEEQDDEIKLTKAGSNPFKKEKIVSKFDVNDLRKIEFVGSYGDDEAEWPRVHAIPAIVEGLFVSPSGICPWFKTVVGTVFVIHAVYTVNDQILPSTI